MEIKPYHECNFESVQSLWEEAFPDDAAWNRASVAIPAKLLVQRELLLVAIEQSSVIGTIMAGYDGHRGWLYAVAVRKSARRAGVGAALVRHAECALLNFGCHKINLQVRTSNAAVAKFYEQLGYQVEDRISFGKRL